MWQNVADMIPKGEFYRYVEVCSPAREGESVSVFFPGANTADDLSAADLYVQGAGKGML